MALIENLLCFRDNVMWQQHMMTRTTKYTVDRDDKPYNHQKFSFFSVVRPSIASFCRPVTSGIIIIINFISFLLQKLLLLDGHEGLSCTHVYIYTHT